MYKDFSYDNELKTVKTIINMKDSLIFDNYINKITFPYFKNLEENTTIHFNFPLTFLIGTNGCGKSSILRALQGCPHGKSLGNYWFSTTLDPIKETGEKGKRNCYWYEYTTEGETREVIKQRMQVSNDPDYWETSRPIKSYGMTPLENGKRHKGIEKKVIYLDFRSELSAFDKYFHLGLADVESTLKNKKQYIRRQSIKLKNAISHKRIYKYYENKQNQLPYELSKDELACISFILGKEYHSGTIIYHKFFKDWGTSVILNNKNFKYTEAMAGSGEIATVKIVHELFKADEGSLILLDEPEVSLHPGAQAKLKYVLLNLIKIKKLQIVISTHSTTLLENMPKNAIKKLELETLTNNVIVKNECYLHEAFNTLGQNHFNSSFTIQVEDSLAANIIKKVLETIDPSLVKHWNICYKPGGAETIKTKFIPIYSQYSNKNIFIIMDGDKKPKEKLTSLDLLPQNQINSKVFDDLIYTATGCKIPFFTDGNHQNGGRSDQKLELQKKYYEFYKNHVDFLPLNTPEEIIWDYEKIKNLLIDKSGILNEISKTDSFKQKIFIASKGIFGNENSMKALEDLLIENWLNKQSAEKNKIINILSKLISNIYERV